MFKKITNCISSVIVAIAVVLAVLLLGVRIVGFTPYTILSPSMSPEYMPGDLVYVQKAAADEIKVGDPITFVADDQLTVVTHRVAEIDEEGRFYTKGDANEFKDANPVIYENVLGVVKFSIPKLGYVANFLSQAYGKYAAATIICIAILLFILPDLIKMWKNPDEDGKSKPQAHLTDRGPSDDNEVK